MTGFATSIKLELFKIKRQGFWLIWSLCTVLPIDWMLYINRDFGPSTRVLYENAATYYYAVQDQLLSILSLVLPIMGGVLISRLCDEEHAGDTWKLLRTSNQRIADLWDAKFCIVYTCMQASLLVTMLCCMTQVHLLLGTPVPLSNLALSFVGASAANFITLTIAIIVSMRYKNQLISLVVSLGAGLVGLLSMLFPMGIVPLLPWGYYTLSYLCGMSGEPAADGTMIWSYYNLSPNPVPFVIMTGIAAAAYFYFRARISEKEL